MAKKSGIAGAFTEKWGGLPVWAWGIGAAILAYIAYRLFSGGSGSSTSAAPPSVVPVYSGIGLSPSAGPSVSRGRRTTVIVTSPPTSSSKTKMIGLPIVHHPSTPIGPAVPAPSTSPGMTAQEKYNSYVSSLLAKGYNRLPANFARQKGTAYENLGVNPFNKSQYITGKYQNGQFVVSYTGLISKTPASFTPGAIVGGFA